GNLLANDSDVDAGATLTLVNTGVVQGQYGALTLQADGGYSYLLDNSLPAVQSLGHGEAVQENFSYQVSDGAAVASAAFTITVRGTNDAPVAVADAAAAAEDGVAAVAGNVLANDQDPDTGTALAVLDAGVLQGRYGQLTLGADGSYSYLLDNARAEVQALGQGARVEEHFDYQASDGTTTSGATLTVTVSGSNDGPVARDDVASAHEDSAAPVTGNLLANDSDVDAGDTLRVLAAGAMQGRYGQLTLDADGNYAYVLDHSHAAVQALGEGATLQDHFGYAVSDGIASSGAGFTVAVNGTNDRPVGRDDVSYMQVGVSAEVAGNVLANDSDLDAGTVLAASPRVAAGRYGTLTLEANGAYRYLLDTSLPAVLDLAPGATLVETFSYDVRDDAPVALAASAQIEIRIAGAAAGTSKLSGHVYVDAGNDGMRNAEPGIAGTVITLAGVDDLGRTVTATTSTDASGYYEFANLRAGRYDLRETQPHDYLDGRDTAGSSGGTVEADAITGIALGAGVHGQENNFGELPRSGSIGDQVFLDSNDNGLRDAGELGASGVMVKLLDAAGAVLSRVATDASGRYLFDGLGAGSYTVQVVAPTGYAYAKRDQGLDDTRDSDVDASGRTAVIRLEAGVNDLSWDAGLKAVPMRVGYNFAGNSSADGPDGNSRVYGDAATGISVSATAWSREKNAGTWNRAWLGSYAGGHGVTDNHEGQGSGAGTHALDNSGRDNYVVYQFSQSVVVDKAFLGYVKGDSDITVWIGNAAAPITTMSNAVLAGLGFTELNLGSGSTRWADINAGGREGNVLVVAARQGEANDHLMVQKLEVSAVPRAGAGLDSQVNRLVEAMAAFGPAGATQGSLVPTAQNNVNPLIAAGLGA
ncbi:MAG TPA: VCBS domain-containing protein, partial [Ramlibacter sp.]|nr:VCBS domain-containing protein [Ramlibacter sp.]